MELERIMRALRAAHEAGDTAAATRLAQMARQAQAASTAPAEAIPATPERSTWDAVVDNVVGRDDGVESYGEMLGSMLNLGGESMTMGLVGDEADALARSAFTDATYDEALTARRAEEAAFREAHPGLSLTADIGGAMALPGGALLRGGGNMAARVAQSGLMGGLGCASYCLRPAGCPRQ